MAKKIDDPLYPFEDIPPEMIDALLRNDFPSFARAFMSLAVPGAEIKWGEYLDVSCAYLGAVADGKIKNLIVTIPPRHLKSTCASVLLPAYFLGRNPTAEVMAISYGQDLATKFGVSTRTVMESKRYTDLFETRLARPNQSASALATKQGGIRRATSMEGKATGLGADLMIFDDPQKAGETPSEAIRRSTNEMFETTFLSRRNDPASCRIVIVMQRLHEDDFVGHVLSLDGDWTVLNLPAIAEDDDVISYQTFLGEHEFRRRTGEALQEEHISAAEFAKIRRQVGEATWSTQYQQRPAPQGGGIVKLEWFRRYTPETLPAKFDRIVQSWDTGINIQQHNDFSVCTTWGELDDNYYLLHVHRERLLYPDLRSQVLISAETWKADVVVVEDQASGQQLLQELPTLKFYKAVGRKPDSNKQIRMSNQTGVMAAGAVLIPEEAPWLPDYLHELMMFPNGRFDDQVDSTSQALAHMTAIFPGKYIMQYYKEEAAKLKSPQPQIVTMRPPANFEGQIFAKLGYQLKPSDDGLYRMEEEDSRPLHRVGFVKVGN